MSEVDALRESNRELLAHQQTLQMQLSRLIAKQERMRTEMRLKQRQDDHRAEIDAARVRGEMGPCEQCVKEIERRDGGRRSTNPKEARVMVRFRNSDVHRWCYAHANQFWANKTGVEGAWA